MGISVSIKRTFILAGFICLVALSEVNCSDPDLKVKSNLNSANSVNSSTEHDGGSSAGLLKKNDEEQLDKPGVDVQKTSQKDNSSIPLESKEVTDGEKKSEVAALDQSLKPKEANEKLVVTGDGLASKSGSKEEENNIGDSNGGSSSSIPLEKVKSRAEECDPSYMCTDKKANLVACLQVPGDESPNLSLLIRNGGKQPLNVKISAAQFVQLEESQVQLQPEEDKMVKVSINGAGNNNSLIYLNAGQGRCTINFKELISSQELKFGDDDDEAQKSTDKLYYLNRLSRTNFYIVTLLAMALILASGWMCVGLGRKYLFKKVVVVDYLPVTMELPISDVSKLSAVQTADDVSGGGGGGDDDVWVDDWDGGWGDDDEEEGVDEEAACMTPTLPVTPSSLSSRGLASRRLSKEGWKD